jgi:hypothetical protein
MNGYELHIQGTDGIWRQADLGEEAPAMNYQSNDITELKDRQASYSQNLKLPQSKRNIEIFEAVNIAGIKSKIPYRRLYCRLYFGVNTIAGEGSFLILLKISDKFECQILSGNADFFETLKNKLMSDLNLPVVRLINSNLHPDNFSDYHLFCISSFSVDTTADIQRGAGRNLPYVKMLPVLNFILQEEGYTMESNILDESGFKNCIMPAIFPKDNETDFGFLKGTARITSPTRGELTTDISPDASGFLTQNEDRITYIAPESGIATIEIHVLKNYSNELWIGVVDKNGTDIYSYHNTGGAADESVEFDLSVGDKISFYVSAYRLDTDGKISENSVELNIDFSFKLSNNTKIPFYGAQIPISGFGFNTRLDFVKAIAQAFGLFAYVNPPKKIVRVYTASFFYTQIADGNILDWSNKVAQGKNEQKFTIENYGQKNYIRFTDTESYRTSGQEIKTTKEIVLEIDDNTLEPEKELFSLSFEAGRDLSIRLVPGKENRLKIAAIPILDRDSDGKYSILEGKPHLCMTSDSTFGADLDPGNIYDYKAAEHIEPDFLKNKFYGNLETGILKESLFIEEELLLTPQDIQDFDPFVPVYLEKHGYYFYVNKIKNFVAGKLTKVELIRL